MTRAELQARRVQVLWQALGLAAGLLSTSTASAAIALAVLWGAT